MSTSNSHSCESTAKLSEHGCGTECGYIPADAAPFGLTIIPGSGKLTEYPISNVDLINVDGSDFLTAISEIDLVPRAYSIANNVCISDCPEYAAAAQLNFINGDLIISQPAVPVPSPILSALSSSNDLLDIFPNLLGINGNLYIVNTTYRRITGFERLRFVTGSIVIVNNNNLVSIPTFPSLLSVGGLVTVTPPTLPPTRPVYSCGRSAIIIANNNALRKIIGFEALRQVKDGIFFANNGCLTHICGFIHLYRTDRIVIKTNPKLAKVVGFGYIDTLNVGLYILDNSLDGQSDLVISAFVKLETAGTIVVTGNAGLRHFKLNSLNIVRNDFIVRSNAQLEELESSVSFVNSLFIENNKSLLVIKFPCLQEVNFFLNINGNCSLVCIEGFDELRRVGHGIMFADNKALVELRGFNKLKYIGSNCVTAPTAAPVDGCVGCGCNTGPAYDWSLISRLLCVVTDVFPVDFFDDTTLDCAYVLPLAFFQALTNSGSSCGVLPVIDNVPGVVSYSLIIFRNQRLKAIGGFCNLKHVESNIYIVANPSLHTINAFGQLAYALDIWIRNNANIKYIIGFANLLSIRDFVVYESEQLVDLNSIKSLEFAQLIATVARTARSIKLPRHAIPSVLGYTLYYAFDRC